MDSIIAENPIKTTTFCKKNRDIFISPPMSTGNVYRDKKFAHLVIFLGFRLIASLTKLGFLAALFRLVDFYFTAFKHTLVEGLDRLVRL